MGESKIISDVSFRRLIVEGMAEVERITKYNEGYNDIINIRKLSNDLYEIEITYKVGDYLNK